MIKDKHGFRCPLCGYNYVDSAEWYELMQTKELDEIACPQCENESLLDSYMED